GKLARISVSSAVAEPTMNGSSHKAARRRGGRAGGGGVRGASRGGEAVAAEARAANERLVRQVRETQGASAGEAVIAWHRDEELLVEQMVQRKSSGIGRAGRGRGAHRAVPGCP